MTGSTTTLTRERADLLESLRRHRGFLRFTVRDLTEEQAHLRPTVSALYLGGLIKHVRRRRHHGCGSPRAAPRR